MFGGFIKSRIFKVMGSATLLLLLFFLAQELRKKYLIKQEIAGLQNEIAELEGQNQDIAKLIKYLKTPESRERQARQLLNLQKPGEFVVALPPEANPEEPPPELKGSQEKISNLKKWQEYFFGL